MFGRILATAILTVATFAIAAPASAHEEVRDGLIAFDDFGTGQIYTIRPDGSHLRQLTHETLPRGAGQAAWSPDGRHIAYAEGVQGTGEVDRIWTMNADGSHERMLFDDPGFGDDYPRYLPDGRGFVFFRCSNTVEACGIAEVDADGTNLRMLTPLREGILDVWPAVSGTGRIAFARFNANGIRVQIYVLSSSGRARPVTPDDLGANIPNWSPSGRRLIFNSCCNLNSNIYTIAPHGSALHQVTHTPYPFASRSAAYSPTGTRVVFQSNRAHPDGCCSDLYVMNADGTHGRRITTGLDKVGLPQWGPAPES